MNGRRPKQHLKQSRQHECKVHGIIIQYERYLQLSICMFDSVICKQTAQIIMLLLQQIIY